jgi:hypothetical protein
LNIVTDHPDRVCGSLIFRGIRRDAIEDEEYLFEGVKLTEKEQADLDYKKRVYELAKKKTEAVDDAMEVGRCGDQAWTTTHSLTHCAR